MYYLPLSTSTLRPGLSSTMPMTRMTTLYAQKSKGKHPINNPPDFEVACRSFQAELEMHKGRLDDWKMAQSIAYAVHEDGALIADLASKTFKLTKIDHVDVRFLNVPGITSA